MIKMEFLPSEAPDLLFVSQPSSNKEWKDSVIFK